MDLEILGYGDSRTLDKKRKEIISVSRELFLGIGIEQTSMKLIADRACITRRSLYNYYESKEKIAIDVQILNLKEMSFFKTWGCILLSSKLPETIKKIPRITEKALGEYRQHYILLSQFDSHFNRGYPDSKYSDFLKREAVAAYPDDFPDFNPDDFRVEWLHANLLLAYIQRLAVRHKNSRLSESVVKSEIGLLTKLISYSHRTAE